MAFLSAEAENEIKSEVLEAVSVYLEGHTKLESYTGLVSARKLKEELEIKDMTLYRWENKGLRIYRPPIEGTKKKYYRITDILKFLGVSN